ncbi:MAG: hypothetical protein WBX15_17330, partial [Thermoanaerobaculia bacterium]
MPSSRLRSRVTCHDHCNLAPPGGESLGALTTNGSGAFSLSLFLIAVPVFSILAADQSSSKEATPPDHDLLGYNFAFFAGSTGGPGWFDGSGGEERLDPRGVAVDAAGDLIVADSYSVRKISGDEVTTLAGIPGFWVPKDGARAAARFARIVGIALGPSGDLYVADEWSLRKVGVDGLVTTVAGTETKIEFPRGIAAGPDGNLYVIQHNAILKFAPDGSTGSRSGPFKDLKGLACDAAGNLYLSDDGARAVYKMSPDGTTTTFAGMPGSYGTNDGTGSEARFAHPWGVGVAPDGTVYVGDNGRLRRISPMGEVTTLSLPSFPAQITSITFDPQGTVLLISGSAVYEVTPDLNVSVRGGQPVDRGLPGYVSSNVPFATPQY